MPSPALLGACPDVKADVDSSALTSSSERSGVDLCKWGSVLPGVNLEPSVPPSKDGLMLIIGGSGVVANSGVRSMLKGVRSDAPVREQNSGARHSKGSLGVWELSGTTPWREGEGVRDKRLTGRDADEEGKTAVAGGAKKSEGNDEGALRGEGV